MGKADRDLRVPLAPPGSYYQKVLDQDGDAVPDILRTSSPLQGGPTEVPVEIYTSRAVHDQEVEKLWKRVWQMACREEEIPEVGDTYLYDIADLKFIVVRVAPDRIRAFSNACLHRARQLVDCPGKHGEFRCPFHGFTWEIDGTLKSVPAAWDFPQISDPDEWRLPEAQVGTWGGFVFINPDAKAQPLKEFLGNIDPHYERYPLDRRYITGHAAKVLPANWKAAQEAFMEGWHVIATHPQLLAQTANHDVQVDIFGNFARAMNINMRPSSSLKWDPTEQQMVDVALDVRLDTDPSVLVPEGTTARRKIADMSRSALRAVIGDQADMYCDAEMVDSFFINIFPNIHPWAAFSRIFFRFRPYGNDPDQSIMDVYILAPFKGARPAPAPVHWLGPDEDWTKAPEIGGYLARILNQDLFNMAPTQAGMKATARKTVTFSQYQEAKIRHFHQLLADWLQA